MVYKDQHYSDSSRLSILTFNLRPFRGLLRRLNIFQGQFIAEMKITS
nr:MAG TPA: hypothetical protein [Caudoviricetes sp.]